jgi:hypothetical protein
VDALTRAVGLLVRQVGHWTPERWARSGHADRTHALVQRLADRAADAEGQPRRPVPRLPSDLALPDQLKVVAADLVAALPSPAVLADAADDVTAVRRTL